MQSPSRRQREVLALIERIRRERGRDPSYREIASVLGRSKSTVSHHVATLRAKGLLARRRKWLIPTEAGLRVLQDPKPAPRYTVPRQPPRVSPEVIERFRQVWDQVARGETWPKAAREPSGIPGPSYCLRCGVQLTPETWSWRMYGGYAVNICRNCDAEMRARQRSRRKETGWGVDDDAPDLGPGDMSDLSEAVGRS